MSRRKPKLLRLKDTGDLARRARIRRRIMFAALLVCIAALTGAGLRFIKRYVELRLAFLPEPPRIVVVDRPAWMSDFLAEQIAAVARPMGLHSAFDQQMLVDTAEKLRTDPRISPWIKQIRSLRRVYGQRPGDTLELDCEFRAPIALVQYQDDFWLVDGDGVRLPDRYSSRQVPRIVYGRDGQTNIRIIQGVRQPPPVLGGQRWTGEDLASGLDLVKLLYGRKCAQEILSVDVSNFAGRRDAREAQLVLVTRRATQVRWGRPINAKDYFVEVSPHQKLDYMDRVYEEYRHIDANHAWIDIRFDKITYPSEEAPVAQASSRR